MKSMCLRVTAIALTALCCSALSTQPSAPRNDPFAFFRALEGNWHGHPTATVIGPVRQDLNLSVTKPTNASSQGAPVYPGTWELRQNLGFFALKGTWQVFWALNDWSAATRTSLGGNMSYCTVLHSLGGPANKYGTMIIEYFNRTALTETSVTWHFDSTIDYGSGNPGSMYPYKGTWTGTWTLTLKDNNTKLHSLMIMGGATHMDVMMTRTNETWENWGTEQKHRIQGLPSVCRLPEGWPAGLGPYAPSASPRDAAATGGARACPLGFTTGAPPQFVTDKVLAREKEKLRAIARGDYQHCYVGNPSTELKIRWTWNNHSEAIDVHMSAKKSADYLALGILPEWPYMKGMDVVLGFVDATSGKGCVQSLYAEQHFGQPSASANTQTLHNTSVYLTESGNTINVKFSRPWATGHHNLETYNPRFQIHRPIPQFQMAFAQGAIFPGGNSSDGAGVCSSSTPGYHGAPHRGMMGIGWKDPASVMPDFKKCE